MVRCRTSPVCLASTAFRSDGHVVRCQVEGSVEPLLKVLATSGVHELLSREPSLEELFLAHYGESSAQLGAVAAHVG